MSREQTKRRFKLWLLSIALAVVLTWYVINPVPRSVHQNKSDDDLPEADQHQKGTRLGENSRHFGMRSGLLPATIPSSTGDEDLPEWPEYIDLD